MANEQYVAVTVDGDLYQKIQNFTQKRGVTEETALRLLLETGLEGPKKTVASPKTKKALTDIPGVGDKTAERILEVLGWQ